MQPVMNERDAETPVAEWKSGSVASDERYLEAVPPGTKTRSCQRFRG